MTTSASGTTFWLINEFGGTEFKRIACVLDYQEGDEYREPNESRKLEDKGAKGTRPGTTMNLDPDVFTLERDPCSEQNEMLIDLHRNGLVGAPPEACLLYTSDAADE